jgi:hypothetical protein
VKFIFQILGALGVRFMPKRASIVITGHQCGSRESTESKMVWRLVCVEQINWQGSVRNVTWNKKTVFTCGGGRQFRGLAARHVAGTQSRQTRRTKNPDRVTLLGTPGGWFCSCDKACSRGWLLASTSSLSFFRDTANRIFYGAVDHSTAQLFLA